MVNTTLAMGSAYAPVVIFCYRRPDHLRRTIESLLRCEGFDLSQVIVYSDGPKNPEEVDAVEKTREIAMLLLGDRAEYHFSTMNAGLARSIIAGVGEIVGRFGRAIVIEDDLVFAPGFLTYMNRALERYAADDRVWQVSGYMFDVPEFRSRSESLFLPITVSWGWATWERSWCKFDELASGWEAIKNDNFLRLSFNLEGAYDYATMLNRQMLNKLDSWAIRWYWSVFREGGLVLFPPTTLTHNHGLDGTGSHGHGLFRNFSGYSLGFSDMIPSISENVICHQEDYLALVRTVKRLNGGLLRKAVDTFASILR